MILCGDWLVICFPCMENKSLASLQLLLSKSSEFLMCKLLIVPKREDNSLAKVFAMLWEWGGNSNPRNNWL